jgi:mono/diheme cytochrome c family protein
VSQSSRNVVVARIAVAAVGLSSVVGISGAASATQAQSPADGVYAPAQASRGETAYGRFCAGCHGTDRQGTDFGPGLSGGELVARWNNRTLADLYALTRSTMPVNSPGGLSAQQYVDLVAFLLREAGFPAGPADLSPDPDRLAQIAFAAAEP